jgi:hypothetical protein
MRVRHVHKDQLGAYHAALRAVGRDVADAGLVRVRTRDTR